MANDTGQLDAPVGVEEEPGVGTEASDHTPTIEPDQPPERERPRRTVSWRNPFTSRMYRTILWSLIPPALLLIVFIERISLAYSQSWIVHSAITLVTLLLIVGAVCATVLRPLSELLRAQASRHGDGAALALVPERYARTDEIGDIIRNHNRIVHSIHDARERYKALIEGLDAVVYEANASSQRFTYISPQLETLLGYPPDMWVQDPASWMHYLHPEDRTAALTKWMEEQSSDVERFNEYRIRASDGRYIWVRDVVRTVTRIDPLSGRPYRHLQGMLLDITDSKKAERRLRQSESRFRSLFENVRDGFALHEIVRDADGNAVDYIFLEANAAFETQTGLIRTEIIGKRVTEVLPGIADDPAGWIARYGEIAQSGRAERFESFAEQLQRWYSVHVYSPSPGRFATLFEDITERKRTEEDLKLRSIVFESTSDAIITTDPQGNIAQWNRGAERTFGYPQDDVLGRSINILFDEKDHQRVRAILEQGRTGAELANVEISARNKDGHSIDVLLSLSALQNSDGDVTELVGIIKDITERMQSERALRYSEARHRLLFDNAGLGIGYFDLDGKILMMNRRACENINARSEDLVGKDASEFLGEEKANELRDRFADIARTGKSLTTEDELGVAGQEEWYRSIWSPIMDESGTVRGVQVISENITAQRMAAEQVEAERDLAKQYLEVAGAMIIVVDRAGHITRVNKHACEVLEYQPDELIGCDVFERLVSPNDVEELRGLLQRSLTGDFEDHQQWQSSFCTKSGEPRTLMWRNSVIRDTDGVITGVIGSGVDITDRLRAEAELSAKTKLLHTIVSTIPGFVFWKDVEGRYLGCNPQFAKAAGFTQPEELLGKTDYDMGWDRDEADFYRECDRKIRESGVPIYNIEETQRRPDGGTVDILTSKVPLLDDDGNAIGILGIFSDISDLKSKERELKRRTRELGDRVKELSCLSHVMRVVRERKSLDEILQDVVDRLPAGWQFPDIACARLCLDGREYVSHSFTQTVWMQECPIVVGEERRGSIEVLYREKVEPFDEGPFLREERDLIKTIAKIIGEAIELREAEAALQHSRDFLQTLADAIPVPVFYKGTDHSFNFVNRALCEFYGRSEGEIIGHTIFDIQPLNRAKELNDMDRQLMTRGGTQEYETTAATVLSPETPVRIHGALLSGGDGEIRGVVGVLMDLSEIKKKEMELRDSGDKMNAILTTIQTGLILVDAETQIVVDVNAVGAQMIGRSHDFIVGRPIAEFVCSHESAYRDWTECGSSACSREMMLQSFQRESIPIINSVTRVHLAGTEYLLESFLDISDRKDAERKLEASERHYRALFENALDIVAVLSCSGVIEYSSPSLALSLGRPPDDFVDIDIRTLLHPDDVHGYARLEGEVLGECRDSVTFEFRLQHTDGSYRQFEGVFGFLPDAKGSPRMVGNARDVTERRREEVIQEVLSRISQATNVTENLEDLIQFTHRQVTRLLDATNFYVALYDSGKGTYSFPYCVDEKEPVELNTSVRLDKSLTDYVRRTGLPLLADGRREEKLFAAGEIALIGLDSIAWLGVPLKTLGEVFGVMAVQTYSTDTLYTDDDLDLLQRLADRISLVVERKRADDDRKRLAIAVEQSAEAIVITDVDAAIQYVNPAFEAITGYSRSDVIGLNPSLLKSGQHPPGFYENLWAVLTRGDKWQGRMINRRKDGSIYHEDATISPVRDSEGVVVNYVAVKRDVTQEIQMESQLRQAQKLEAVGSLAAGIAHEINTPIQFVGDNIRFLSDSFDDLIALLDTTTTMCQSLKDHPGLGDTLQSWEQAYADTDLSYLREEIPRAINQTMDGVQRVTSIVGAMKDFSHPDKGEKSCENINRALTSTLTVARNELKYIADVDVDLQSDLPPVSCYISDLNQVFLNLLVNAAHAIADRIGPESTDKGTITVRTRQDGDNVVIEIGDTGSGIPDRLRDRIFDPFFTTKPVGRGTGQGLSISRSVVVDKHGGTITFDSEVGVGSTFRITLPIEDPMSVSRPGPDAVTA